MLRHGWRTGAIVPELETEIRIINTEQYMHSLTWQQALTGLLERMQVHCSCLSGTVICCLLSLQFEFSMGIGDVLSCLSPPPSVVDPLVSELQWKLERAEVCSAGLMYCGAFCCCFTDVSGCRVKASVARVDEGTAGDQVRS